MKEDRRVGKPHWLKSPIPTGAQFFRLKKTMRQRSLATVCEEAKCPNIGQCWNEGGATFMIMGDTCTRACRFCHVKTGDPGGWLDEREPEHVATSCAEMDLDFIVMTMVDRDDLPDGGASHIAKVVRVTKERCPKTRVELLVGDFRGDEAAVTTVLSARPEVYAHNIETVKRLSPRVRDARAHYDTSLAVLAAARKLAAYPVVTKSAIMLGLGETREELTEAMRDLREHGVSLLTIGQYMRPTKRHLSVKEWVRPEVFKELEAEAYELGFAGVASGPLVRSSYRAGQLFDRAFAAGAGSSAPCAGDDDA